MPGVWREGGVANQPLQGFHVITRVLERLCVCVRVGGGLAPPLPGQNPGGPFIDRSSMGAAASPLHTAGGGRGPPARFVHPSAAHLQEQELVHHRWTLQKVCVCVTVCV